MGYFKPSAFTVTAGFGESIAPTRPGGADFFGFPLTSPLGRAGDPEGEGTEGYRRIYIHKSATLIRITGVIRAAMPDVLHGDFELWIEMGGRDYFFDPFKLTDYVNYIDTGDLRSQGLMLDGSDYIELILIYPVATTLDKYQGTFIIMFEGV